MPDSTSTSHAGLPSRSTRRAKLRQDQLQESYSPDHGDLLANRKLMMVACEALIANVQNRSTDRYMQPGETKMRSIDAPATLSSVLESINVKSDADVRIFFEHDGIIGHTFILGTLSEGKIYPYSFGRIEAVQNRYIFDDGVNEHNFLAESAEAARLLWEDKVPERMRSADTNIRVERVTVAPQDPSGPFLVEYVGGSKVSQTLGNMIDTLASRKGPYKVFDKEHKVIIEVTEASKPTPVAMNKVAIMEAKKRGASVVQVERAGSEPTVFVGTCLGSLTEGSRFIIESPDGKPAVGKVVESGSAFALIEAILVEEAHIDDLRNARNLSVTFEAQEIVKASEPITAAIVNHRVVVAENVQSHSGLQGTIVEPALDDEGCPIGRSSKYNPMKECFVRLDSGELSVFNHSSLRKL